MYIYLYTHLRAVSVLPIVFINVLFCNALVSSEVIWRLLRNYIAGFLLHEKLSATRNAFILE